MNEIDNLNATLSIKNTEQLLLLELEKKFVFEHERVTDELKNHIKRLQDKIFEIHRSNELELFNAIDRLKTAHKQDLKGCRDEFRRVETHYEERVATLNNVIDKLREELVTVESHLKTT